MRSGDSPPKWVHWDVLHKLYATAPAGTPEARMDSLISSQVLSGDDGGPSTSAGPSTPATPATPLISRRKRRSEADITTYLRSSHEEYMGMLRSQEEREERALDYLRMLVESVVRGPPSNYSLPLCHPNVNISPPYPSPPISIPSPSPPIPTPTPSPPMPTPTPSRYELGTNVKCK
ncbi:recQ-mediated genome instability protein 1-like [Ischnura elegans]|uniref:recQ-mediated genome instability protein 1-like n=1 Tax=Ischnura elegans TaxID=197161 RepID=UPI001ED8B63C|nr:recQ-mediated genome instability protein 1-like [Ischnura elegans]